MKAHLWTLTILAACGGGGGSNPGSDANTPDAPKVFLDAPPVVPAMIAISGTAFNEQPSGSTPLAGVAIGVYRRGSDTPLATATSDAQGKYSVMIPTSAQPVDGYTKGSKPNFTDNYGYPATPWIADVTDADAHMLTMGSYKLLVQSVGQASVTNGVIVIQVVDASSQPVEGATVESAPAAGKYRYNNANGVPSSTTATPADGVAVMFDVPPGEVMIMADKAGATFKSHELVARAGAFTTTAIKQ